ncbi:synaptic vesicle membrane protein VAT-1 homolog [Maniola jurtina]|uniref:synaptic vesicle membrane protein VAT-1 homolog n=1 Tax=Maniola jurtina TaxID=191418 RepID=UPI001E68A18C|nr:synaptic vesicle membrane protein VAT-1 homolog [Maniola jurtina]
MKLLIALCFVALVGLSLAQGTLYPNGCIWIEGRCAYGCEDGTHDYTTGCDYVTPEATCDNPNPVPDIDAGEVCDYTACYCNSPTVRDTTTNKCVRLEDCPKKEEEKKEVEKKEEEKKEVEKKDEEKKGVEKKDEEKKGVEKKEEEKKDVEKKEGEKKDVEKKEDDKKEVEKKEGEKKDVEKKE